MMSLRVPTIDEQVYVMQVYVVMPRGRIFVRRVVRRGVVRRVVRRGGVRRGVR